IEPNLPRWLENDLIKFESNTLALGLIDSSWNLERIGEFGFVVDVFVIKSIVEFKECLAIPNYFRYGTAVIGRTMERPSLQK
ncbi:MAG: hypothetical protein AAGA18_14900, partial [Verrucomicrobiota bacterium]